jgi:cell division protease FtsH
MVQSSFDMALALLSEERDTLEEGARQLLDKETLGEAELKALYSRVEQTATNAASASVAEDA